MCVCVCECVRACVCVCMCVNYSYFLIVAVMFMEENSQLKDAIEPLELPTVDMIEVPASSGELCVHVCVHVCVYLCVPYVCVLS